MCSSRSNLLACMCSSRSNYQQRGSRSNHQQHGDTPGSSCVFTSRCCSALHHQLAYGATLLLFTLCAAGCWMSVLSSSAAGAAVFICWRCCVDKQYKFARAESSVCDGVWQPVHPRWWMRCLSAAASYQGRRHSCSGSSSSSIVLFHLLTGSDACTGEGQSCAAVQFQGPAEDLSSAGMLMHRLAWQSASV
jgi:hypothetical protein